MCISYPRLTHWFDTSPCGTPRTTAYATYRIMETWCSTISIDVPVRVVSITSHILLYSLSNDERKQHTLLLELPTEASAAGDN